MLFCKYTFECISDYCILLKKLNIYLTEIKKGNSKFLPHYPAVSKNLITFPLLFRRLYCIQKSVDACSSYPDTLLYT